MTTYIKCLTQNTFGDTVKYLDKGGKSAMQNVSGAAIRELGALSLVETL